MLRLPTVLAVFAACAAAQDHIIPFGFSSANGNVGNDNKPAARLKDNDLDGVVSPVAEMHTFLSTCFHSAAGTCFMTDARAVLVNGEYEFYFTDTEQGRIVRGVDRNHNGLLDRGEDVNGNGVMDPGEDTNANLVLDTEVNEFVFFGVRTGQVNLLAPDTLAVYRDTTTNQTRVYAALDQNSDPSYGFVRGIYRSVDLNGDGDAKDAGETTPFVNAGMGLTVPGTSGPVTLSAADTWTQMRVLPGGKLIAYAQGNPIATGGALQPSMNAFYGFTDNNGTAVPEVWFNCSLLNNLPRHPDWVSGTYPDWDVVYGTAPTTGSRNFARWLAVAPQGGPAGVFPAYFIASSYNVVPPPNTSGNPGDLNAAGQHVAGLIYRVVDLNFNQAIDAGELSLWANLSGTTYAGVAPVGFTNHASTLINSLVDRTWGVDATANGEFSFTYANGGPEGVVTLRDLNQNGVIEAGETSMVWAATTNTGPLGTGGGFFTYFQSIQDGTLPGPFPVGIAPYGEGCQTTTAGLRMVMDAWGGSPQIGNANFKLGPIRGIAGSVAVLALAAGPSAPIPLSVIGGPAGCTIDIDPGTFSLFGLQFTDAFGRTIFNTPIPNTPFLIGGVAYLQAAEFDVATAASLQWHSTNALAVTIQP